MSRLPQVSVFLCAVALGGTGADVTAQVLAAVHAVTVVVALRWPAPAWWLAMAMTVVVVVGHPPTPDNWLWVWAVQALVLLLLSLRVRPFSAAVATAVTALLMLVLKLSGTAVGDWPVTAIGSVLLVVGTVLGSVRRGRREDRARLAEQFVATAHERAARTVLEERARIARELHDVVAHHMSLISVQADAARYRVPDPPTELVSEFASIRAGALEALTELRRLLGVLRFEAPGDGAAGTAPQPSLVRLDDLLDSARAAGMTVILRVRGTVRALPPGVELSAYRVVQEALSNALRHAPGAEVRVRIGYGHDMLTLSVTNTPVPVASGPSPGAGHGLTGMRERAAMLGGELTVGPASDGGWEVRAVLPVPAPPTGKERTP
ncbi:sensor histidine kinase [Streptomyces sp. WMMC940]|uniref:sensor histidine kinase n=1 Tax=Streptomyces sp. WMMC940 TaxID=3015153 RepID=UPI0022B63169|nr:sensor histidine kinase [Streptomyces sp. WMMC940]MCZ7462359.1 sensor histidine kinase [Streptomyces sp. WMMC940]